MELVVRCRSIKTTVEHPFYVPAQNDFVPAGQIKAGDHLISHDGELVQVDAVHSTAEVTTVYNLQVADHHTYFVGGTIWGWDVWVHNANYQRFGSAEEVANFKAAGGNFTGKPGHPGNPVRFGQEGTIDPARLARSAATRDAKYSHRFDVEISDELVADLIERGVREAPGHVGSLAVPQGELLDLLNAHKGAVVITNITKARKR